MPLPVAHSLVGASIVAALYPQGPSRFQIRPLLVGALVALCADFDFLLIWLFHFDSAHRGFTHSVAFAGGIGFITLGLFGRTHLKPVLVYGLAYMSHGFLDFLTTRTGQGVMLLWPFSDERLRFGIWEFSKSPFDLSAEELVITLLKEAAIFLPPLLAILFAKGRIRK
jgi:membrane-bound metal-dependent hydrolase YbcI (DUF457 family)